MGLLNWIFSVDRDAQVAELARRVAEDQGGRVWRQLAARAGSLRSEPEARGYIRCRAQRVLHCGLQSLVVSADLTPDLQQRIIDQAMELTVGRFVAPLVASASVLDGGRRAA